MPHVSPRTATTRSGGNTRAQIDKSHPADKARDNLSGAFAGNENRGPGKHAKDGHSHSTNVKSRRNEKSKVKTAKI